MCAFACCPPSDLLRLKLSQVAWIPCPPESGVKKDCHRNCHRTAKYQAGRSVTTSRYFPLIPGVSRIARHVEIQGGTRLYTFRVRCFQPLSRKPAEHNDGLARPQGAASSSAGKPF